MLLKLCLLFVRCSLTNNKVTAATSFIFNKNYKSGHVTYVCALCQREVGDTYKNVHYPFFFFFQDIRVENQKPTEQTRIQFDIKSRKYDLRSQTFDQIILGSGFSIFFSITRTHSNNQCITPTRDLSDYINKNCIKTVSGTVMDIIII